MFSLLTRPSFGRNPHLQRLVLRLGANGVTTAPMASTGMQSPSLSSSPTPLYMSRSMAAYSSTTFNTMSSSTNNNNNDPQLTFVAKPPTKLTLEIAKGIQDGNKLILRYGIGQQRLQLLSTQTNLLLVQKWQRMMEIYLGAQLHIIAALGYETNEQGIMMYTQQLATFIQGCDYDTQEEFRKMGRETWRHMLATAFALDTSTLQEEMSIVDARNTVHKVASKLMEPSILEMVAQTCAKLPPQSDPNMEMGMKHQIIQDIVVNQVYLGGGITGTSLVEELGFGTGEQGYAKMQYVMAYYENDPLCSQYTSSAMMKIWHAAGLDLGGTPGAVAKMPLSAPGA